MLYNSHLTVIFRIIRHLSTFLLSPLISKYFLTFFRPFGIISHSLNHFQAFIQRTCHWQFLLHTLIKKLPGFYPRQSTFSIFSYSVGNIAVSSLLLSVSDSSYVPEWFFSTFTVTVTGSP